MSSIRFNCCTFIALLVFCFLPVAGAATPMPQHIITGVYQGICQGRVVSIELDASQYENPYVGAFTFGENSNRYTIRCFRTSNASVYEVRVLRMTNPAILGEYLAWRANIEVVDSETLNLTVIKDLSTVEKVKYTLPNQGSSSVLKIRRDKDSAPLRSDSSATLLRGSHRFTGSLTINSQTLQVAFNLDFSSKSGSSTYSSTPLPLTISSIQESQIVAKFTLTERNPNRTSIPDNQLGGNITAIYHCTYFPDGLIRGWGQNYKGNSFTFSLSLQY